MIKLLYDPKQFIINWFITDAMGRWQHQGTFDNSDIHFQTDCYNIISTTNKGYNSVHNLAYFPKANTIIIYVRD